MLMLERERSTVLQRTEYDSPVGIRVDDPVFESDLQLLEREGEILRSSQDLQLIGEVNVSD